MIVKNEFLKMTVAILYHEVYKGGDPVEIGPFKTKDVFENNDCKTHGGEIHKVIENIKVILGNKSGEHVIPDSGVLDLQLGKGYHLLVRYYGDDIAKKLIEDLCK